VKAWRRQTAYGSKAALKINNDWWKAASAAWRRHGMAASAAAAAWHQYEMAAVAK
jgi:hypothetical protein